eukprot:977829-Lingulodinium_polyedra.AAC.1
MPGAPRKRPAASSVADSVADVHRPRFSLMYYKAAGAYGVRDKESNKQVFQVHVPGLAADKLKDIAEKAREAMESGASVADGKELAPNETSRPTLGCCAPGALGRCAPGELHGNSHVQPVRQWPLVAVHGLVHGASSPILLTM